MCEQKEQEGQGLAGMRAELANTRAQQLAEAPAEQQDWWQMAPKFTDLLQQSGATAPVMQAWNSLNGQVAVALSQQNAGPKENADSDASNAKKRKGEDSQEGEGRIFLDVQAASAVQELFPGKTSFTLEQLAKMCKAVQEAAEHTSCKGLGRTQQSRKRPWRKRRPTAVKVTRS